MHAVGQQDNVSLAGGVNPNGGSGEAGMAEGADGEQLAAIAGKRRIDIPAEAAQHRLVGRALRLGELFDSRRADDAHAVQLAAVEQHLREFCQVIGGGEHAGVSGHSAHAAGGGVMDHPAQRNLALGHALGGRDAGHQLGRRIEHGVGHAQRLEDVVVRVIRNHLPAEAMDQLAHQDEIDIAIDEVCAGRAGGLDGVRHLQRGLVAAPRLVQREIGRQAGEMRHQVANGDLAVARPGIPGCHWVMRSFRRNLPSSKSLIQGGGGGHHLGERGEIEDGVRRHRLHLGHHGAVAVRLSVNHLAVVPHYQHGAGEAAISDGLVNGGVNVLGAGECLGRQGGSAQSGAPEKPHITLMIASLEPPPGPFHAETRGKRRRRGESLFVLRAASVSFAPLRGMAAWVTELRSPTSQFLQKLLILNSRDFRN